MTWKINELMHLRKSIAEIVKELVMGPKQTPNIRQALLHNIGKLCCFFDQRQCNEFSLPILPAFLNDRDEQLRALFHGKIIYVCFIAGPRSVEEYLSSYIDQVVGNQTEAVTANALECDNSLQAQIFVKACLAQNDCTFFSIVVLP